MPFWLKATLCIIVVEVAGILSGFLGASSIGDWYTRLERPPGTPPNWLFGPAWTILYALMGLAAARIWHRGEPAPARNRALIVFLLQFLLNLAWTPVFFGAHRMALALVVIVALFATIATTILLFRPLDRPASRLLLPYLCWVGFATYLNAGFLILNT